MRRRLLSAMAALLLATSICLCDGTDPLSATKPDPVGKPVTSESGLPALAQMLGAVVLVGALVKWGLPKWLKPKLSTPHGTADGSLKVIETAQGGSGTYQIVEAMGRRFLVATGGGGMTLLAELTTPSFGTVLDHAAASRERGGESVMPEPASHEATDIRDRVAAAAARLDELIGH